MFSLRFIHLHSYVRRFLARDFAGVLEQQDPVLRHAPTFTDPSPGLGSLRRSLSGEKPRPKGKVVGVATCGWWLVSKNGLLCFIKL